MFRINKYTVFSKYDYDGARECLSSQSLIVCVKIKTEKN